MRPTEPPSVPVQRDVTRQVIIGIALVAVALLLWRVRAALLVGFGAIVFATALRALADVLRHRCRLSERWSVLAATGLVLISLVAFGWLFGAQTAKQFAALRDQLPAAVEKFRSWVATSPVGKVAVDAIKGTAEGGEQAAANGPSKVGKVATGIAGGIVGGLGHLLIVIFAGVYFAMDPALYREGALRLLPPSRRPQVRAALNEAGLALRKWLVAQLIVMAAVGVVTGIGLALIGLPLALSLGLLTGVLEFVPVIGPFAAAIPGVLLGFAKGPETALYAALVYLVVQQLEGNVLTPLMQKWAVQLPPVVAVLSIVACGLLFGLMGVLLATPLAVVVMALVRHLYVEDTLENHATRRTRLHRPSGST